MPLDDTASRIGESISGEDVVMLTSLGISLMDSMLSHDDDEGDEEAGELLSKMIEKVHGRVVPRHMRSVGVYTKLAVTGAFVLAEDRPDTPTVGRKIAEDSLTMLRKIRDLESIKTPIDCNPAEAGAMLVMTTFLMAMIASQNHPGMVQAASKQILEIPRYLMDLVPGMTRKYEGEEAAFRRLKHAASAVEDYIQKMVDGGIVDGPSLPDLTGSFIVPGAEA